MSELKLDLVWQRESAWHLARDWARGPQSEWKVGTTASSPADQQNKPRRRAAVHTVKILQKHTNRPESHIWTGQRHGITTTRDRSPSAHAIRPRHTTTPIQRARPARPAQPGAPADRQPHWKSKTSPNTNK